jgi:hypothetical protein
MTDCSDTRPLEIVTFVLGPHKSVRVLRCMRKSLSALDFSENKDVDLIGWTKHHCIRTRRDFEIVRRKRLVDFELCLVLDKPIWLPGRRIRLCSSTARRSAAPQAQIARQSRRNYTPVPSRELAVACTRHVPSLLSGCRRCAFCTCSGRRGGGAARSLLGPRRHSLVEVLLDLCLAQAEFRRGHIMIGRVGRDLLSAAGNCQTDHHGNSRENNDLHFCDFQSLSSVARYFIVPLRRTETALRSNKSFVG